jgi:hypothetical protein
MEVTGGGEDGWAFGGRISNNGGTITINSSAQWSSHHELFANWIGAANAVD